MSNVSADSGPRPSSWLPLCPLQPSCLRCQSSGRPSATCWAPWCCGSTWMWTKPASVRTNPAKKSISGLKSAESGSPPSCVSRRRWTGPAAGRPPLGGGVVDGPAHHHRLPGSHLHPLLLLPSLHAGKKQRKSHFFSAEARLIVRHQSHRLDTSGVVLTPAGSVSALQLVSNWLNTYFEGTKPKLCSCRVQVKSGLANL